VRSPCCISNSPPPDVHSGSCGVFCGPDSDQASDSNTILRPALVLASGASETSANATISFPQRGGLAGLAKRKILRLLRGALPSTPLQRPTLCD
jgi:hypothetical protein